GRPVFHPRLRDDPSLACGHVSPIPPPPPVPRRLRRRGAGMTTTKPSISFSGFLKPVFSALRRSLLPGIPGAFGFHRLFRHHLNPVPAKQGRGHANAGLLSAAEGAVVYHAASAGGASLLQDRLLRPHGLGDGEGLAGSGEKLLGHVVAPIVDDPGFSVQDIFAVSADNFGRIARGGKPALLLGANGNRLSFAHQSPDFLQGVVPLIVPAVNSDKTGADDFHEIPPFPVRPSIGYHIAGDPSEGPAGNLRRKKTD